MPEHLPGSKPNPNPNEVIDSLDALKKTHRFDWLVEMCTHYKDDDDLDNKGHDDFDLPRATTDGDGGGSGDGGDPRDTRALRRVKGIETTVCCLRLMNAIISFPESVDDRQNLHSEFMGLSMLDVLRLRPKAPWLAAAEAATHLSRARPTRLLRAGPCAPGAREEPRRLGFRREAVL